MKRRRVAERSFAWPVKPGVAVEVRVTIPLETAAYVGFSREQIAALLDGIGKVVAASGTERKEGKAS